MPRNRTFRLEGEVMDAVTEYAASEHIDESEALMRMIVIAKIFHDKKREGCEIFTGLPGNIPLPVDL